MPSLHTAEIQRLLATPVSLDLGTTTGLLAEIKGEVAKLDDVKVATDTLPNLAIAIDGVKADTATLPHVVASVAAIRTATDTLPHVAASVHAIKAITETLPRELAFLFTENRDRLLSRLDQLEDALGSEQSPEDFDVSPRAEVPAKLLANAMALALGVQDAKAQTRLDALRKEAEAVAKHIEDDELKTRFVDAFSGFEVHLPSRKAQFVGMHKLIHELALHFRD